MGINWDIVNANAQVKAAEFAARSPNRTVEDSYFQGYIQNAAELESLRIISARQAARIEELEGRAQNDATTHNRRTALAIPEVTRNDPTPSAPVKLGGFL